MSTARGERNTKKMRLRSIVSAIALMMSMDSTPVECFGALKANALSGKRISANTRRYFRNFSSSERTPGGESTGTIQVPTSVLKNASMLRRKTLPIIPSTDNGSSTGNSNAMPTWLRNPQGHLFESNWASLKDAMMQSAFTESETQKLLSAIHQAAYGDRDKMAGAAEFCHILVETMEMGLFALIAAVYHYCSCVTARQRGATAPASWNSESSNHNTVEDFTHRGLGACGELSVLIARDAAKLKRLETVADLVLKQNSSSSCREDGGTTCSNTARVVPDSNDCENLKNLLLAETKDWRALAIRAAAALYRMRGILKEGPQFKVTTESGRVSREALHIYAPLASRLGMHRLKNELEGAAFRILYRRQFETVNALARQVRSNNGEHETTLNYSGFAQETRSSISASSTSVDIGESMKHVLNEVKDEMTQMLHDDKVFAASVKDFSVTARVKESYSMWKKMLSNNYDHVLQVPDAVALRIVLDARKFSEDEPESVTRARERALCYYAQKLCLERWHPTEEAGGRFKDYIENPKPNGYQSLHYTANTNWGGEDWTLEIQVRSGEMHNVAEFGFASHWDYKAQQKSIKSSGTDAQTPMHDLSMDAYMRKVQEWHWQQSAVGSEFDVSFSKAASSSSSKDEANSPFMHPHLAESTARAERIRERTKELGPYLQALTEAQSDLARESVFVFWGDSEKCKMLSLPNGACVLDALREAEKQFGAQLPLRDDLSQVSCNGALAKLTARLHNGDLINVPKSDGDRIQAEQ